MKILVVGGSGTIGQAIVKNLSERHQIVVANAHSGDAQVDLSDAHSIKTLYEKIGSVDAVVCAAGLVHFDDLTAMTPELFKIGLENKLMGQVNLVLHGLNHVNDRGSFTLISGLLNRDPIRYGVSAAMVNGALEGFVTGAAIEMPRSLRINLVSPTVVKESLPAYETYFRGYPPVEAQVVAAAFEKCVEGLQTGQVLRVGW
ncbi:MAG: short chain dehydrogenase [Legionellales bacterium]|nr:short chain dehydrogenase [Legionellales bacterium]